MSVISEQTSNNDMASSREDEHDHSVPAFGLEAEGKPNMDPFTAVK